MAHVYEQVVEHSRECERLWKCRTLPQAEANIEGFLRERIRTRLEMHLPALSDTLLVHFNQALKAPWFPVPVLKMVDDTGPLVSGKPAPKNCVYGQWVERLQNTEMKTAVYVLTFNKSLDDRLRQLLSAREYKIQKATLVLHEAIYGSLYHAGLKDAGYTRSLMNFLLMPDRVFERHILDTTNNGVFGYFWIGELLPVLTSTSLEFNEFQQTQKIWSDRVASQWGQYISFLKKMNFSMKQATEFMLKSRLPPFHVYQAIRFGNSESHFFRSVTFVVFASDWSVLTKQAEPRITDLEGFYLLATELETQRRIESVQRLALSEPSDPAWKRACEQVKAQELIWKSLPPAQNEEDRTIRGVSDWIAYKALNHCVKQKIIAAAK